MDYMRKRFRNILINEIFYGVPSINPINELSDGNKTLNSVLDNALIKKKSESYLFLSNSLF